MSYDDEGCNEDCHCSCAGCSMHMEEEVAWPSGKTFTLWSRLNKIACAILGHKRIKCLGKWVECDRCGEHISGPVPGHWERWAHREELTYWTRANAVLVNIKVPDTY